MRFGIDVAQQRAEFAEIVERVRFGEDLGFDGAWGFDHFVPMYGEGPGNCFEGMTTLAALAAATSTIRLGLLVTGVTYRHPSILAAEAVTVDHASGGRLELALGAAWFEPEHRQLGLEFPPTGRRFDMLEDELEMLTRLFTGEVVSYQGARVHLGQCPDAAGARAATAPADLDRRLGAPANAPSGRAVGGRVAHLRQPRPARRVGHGGRPPGGGGGARPGVRSCGHRRCRCPSPGTTSGVRWRPCATSVSAISCAGGPVREVHASRSS